jgi:hypothetical protein
MRILITANLALALTLAIMSPARAGGPAKAVQEAAEFLLKKFGREVAGEGAEKLTGRIASAVSRHGDNVLIAVRRVGPRALSLADEAGEHAPQAMRLLTRYGDDAVTVLSRPKGMALFARYGDDAASALIKHQGVAEPLVERMGRPAVEALGAVGARSGRRLVMMADGGELAALGRTPEVMGVIARYGDPAMEFIWRNKGALAVGTALTAFLANPQPFIDGTTQLTGTVAENAVRPAVVAAGNVAQEAAGFLRWSLTIVVAALAVGLGFAVKNGASRKGIGRLFRRLFEAEWNPPLPGARPAAAVREENGQREIRSPHAEDASQRS